MMDSYISTDGGEKLRDELWSIAGQQFRRCSMQDDAIITDDRRTVGVCYFNDENRPWYFCVPGGKYTNKINTELVLQSQPNLFIARNSSRPDGRHSCRYFS